jgi:hypothetical protein
MSRPNDDHGQRPLNQMESHQTPDPPSRQRHADRSGTATSARNESPSGEGTEAEFATEQRIGDRGKRAEG